MSRPSFVCLLMVNMILALAAELSAQETKTESLATRRFNQVFVKVIVPVTSRTPKQDGPVVELWVEEQLEQVGVSEYFAVTDWVPVCDALRADGIVDNDVWDGRLESKHAYCAVSGDIPERENGRVLVSVAGWLPFAGCEATTKLLDEPGNRAVVPVELHVGEESESLEVGEALPFVAVLIAPPLRESETSPRDDKQKK